MEKITKKFPGVLALSEVSFELNTGEIHALMGENGAGKSTLIKVLTGVHQADSGQIYYEGKQIKPSSTLEAQRIGISTVYQEVNLCPNLSVAENIFIGREPIKNFKIDWQEMNDRAKELLRKFDLDIDVTKNLSYYTVAIQQMVAIVRALDISAKILILDEPTSSLDKDETEKLFGLMRKLKKEGIAIIFITHFIDDVYEIADTITVLRNGKLIDKRPIDSFPKLEMVAKMIGKELETLSDIGDKTTVYEEKDDKLVVKARQLSSRNISPFDLEIYEGQVVGLAGLLGSGRTELVNILFGLDQIIEGELLVDGELKHFSSPKEAMDEGFSLCPEDRKTDGLLSDLSVRENMTLGLQVKNGYFNSLSIEEQNELCEKFVKILNIATPSLDQQVKNLSGGNQQKVILARWLMTNPKVLILDEPTRGIDVGTKADIQKFVIELAEEGKSIVFISSELDEVIRVSNSVTVLRDRRKIAEVKNEDINRNNIMNLIATGGESL